MSAKGRAEERWSDPEPELREVVRERLGPDQLTEATLARAAALTCDVWQVPEGPILWRLGMLAGQAGEFSRTAIGKTGRLPLNEGSLALVATLACDAWRIPDGPLLFRLGVLAERGRTSAGRVR